MPKMIHVKLTRMGKREARQIRKWAEREKALEAKIKAVEEEEKLLKQVRYDLLQKHLKKEVQEAWKDYHRTKDQRFKDKIGEIIQKAEDEGVKLVSP